MRDTVNACRALHKLLKDAVVADLGASLEGCERDNGPRAYSGTREWPDINGNAYQTVDVYASFTSTKFVTFNLY